MSDIILGGDFTVYYSADASRKQIKWSGSATGTRTVNELYSALQDLFDELAQMDDGIPMSAQTPTEYTIGAIDASDDTPWFIDDESIQHLKGGALKTSLWTRVTGAVGTGKPGIIKVAVSANAAIVYGDIGNSITATAGSSSTGTLVDLQGSGASTILFIRPTDSTSTHDWTGTTNITCNAHATGAMTCTVYTGESLWANIYSLGSLAVDKGNNAISDLYVYKNGTKVQKLSSGVAGYQWWPTGHIDILMKVKEAGATTFTGNTHTSTTIDNLNINAGLLRVGQPIFGSGIAAGTTIASIVSYNSITISAATSSTLTGTALYANTIDGANVTVFAREYDNTYDYFSVDLNTGGRNPIPLATGDDLNNHTGIKQYSASAGSGTFQAGEIIYVGTWPSSVTAKGVVTAVTGTGASSVIKYYLIGDLTAIASGNTVTGVVSGATITNGTVADNAAGTNPASLTGMAINSVIGGYGVDINNGNGTKYYSIQIDPGANKYVLSTMYEWTKYVTRRGSTDTTNNNGINGECYIGPDYKLSYTTLTGSQMTSGDTVFQAATGAFGKVVTHDTTNKFIIVRNTRGSFGTGTVYDVNAPTKYTDSGTTAGSITPIKPNPYGTFAGGKFFAAPGVCFNNTNLAAGDIQAYQLTALDGTVQVPPNVVSVGITGLSVGDAAGVFQCRGSVGVVDKASYTMPTTTPGDTSIVVTNGTRTAIASDEPTAGFLRVVFTVSGTQKEEHRYRYSSWAGQTFTLATVTTGQGAALTATAAQYWDSRANAAASGGNLLRVTLGTAISTSELQIGDSVYTYATGTPTTHVGRGAIVKIEDTTHLWIRVFGTVTLGDWSGTGNSIRYNRIIENYTTSDKVYVPVIDSFVSSGSSLSNNLIYSADIPVLVRVRQYKSILPFEQSTTVGSTGLSVSTIRSADSIAT